MTRYDLRLDITRPKSLKYIDKIGGLLKWKIDNAVICSNFTLSMPTNRLRQCLAKYRGVIFVAFHSN